MDGDILDDGETDWGVIIKRVECGSVRASIFGL